MIDTQIEIDGRLFLRK